MHAGTYSEFTLDAKPLSMLGLERGQVQVLGSSRVNDAPGGTTTSLTDLEFDRLSSSACTGVVVLDGVQVTGTGAFRLSVDGCADVRGFELDVEAGLDCSLGFSSGTLVMDSRLELVQGALAGRRGCEGAFGEAGLTVQDAARVHLAATSALGGTGGDDSCGPFICACPGLPGGPGLDVQGASVARVAGPSSVWLGGGNPGFPDNCPGSGSGCALQVTGAGSAASHSGVTLVPSGACTSAGGSAGEVSPPDPWLERVQVPAAGQVLRFNVHGEVGDVVTLYLGRTAVVTPLAGVDVEQLTSEERAFPLGSIGAQGFATFVFTVPGYLPRGFTFFAQARLLRGGAELRTNSTPVVLR